MKYKSFLGSGMASRGLRNNNPGNIRISGSGWAGKVPRPQNTDGSFEQFAELRYGFRALILLLKNYMERHGLRTVRGIVSRFAPPNENQTETYINSMAAWTGFGADQELSPDKRTLLKLAHSVARKENRAEDFRFVTPKDVEDGYSLLEGEGKKKKTGLVAVLAALVAGATAAAYHYSR